MDCGIMKKIIFLLMVILCITTGCQKQDEPKTDALRLKEEYEKFNGKMKEDGSIYDSVSIPEDNAIVYSSMSEILSLLKNGTGIIYFGSPTCPRSRSVVSILLHTANMVGIDSILYFDASDIRDVKYLDESGKIVTKKEGTKEYDDLVNTLYSVLPIYKEINQTEIKRLYFPTVIFVKEGNILNIQNGTLVSLVDSNPIEETELASFYSSYMHEILGDVCNQDCQE